MSTLLRLYDDDDSTLTTAIPIADLVAGTPSSALAKHLWNHKGAGSGSTAEQIRLSVKARQVSVGGPYLAEGIDVLDTRAFQVKVTGGNGITPTPTGWMDVGAGSSPALPDLPYNSAVELELRVDPNAAMEDDDLEFLVQISTSPSFALGDGASQHAPDGIVLRLGNTDEVGILRVGTVTETPTTPDFNVVAAGWMWVAEGDLQAFWDDSVTVGATDSAAASLDPGDTYVALLTGAADGSITVTKGVKSAGTAVAPEQPVGEPLLATIVVPDDEINDEDITVAAGADYFALSTDLGSVGPGIAIVDNRLIRLTGPSAILGLEPSANNTIWLERNGTVTPLETTSPPTKPSAGARPLWTVTADATPEISAIVADHRNFVGMRQVQLQLRIEGTNAGELQVGDASLIFGAPMVGGERCWVHPLAGGMVLYTDDAGNTMTAGETSVDLEVRPAGSTFASIFDGADLGQLTQVAYDNANLFAAGHFAVWAEMLEGDQLVAVVNSIPTATAVPAACTLVVNFLVG